MHFVGHEVKSPMHYSEFTPCCTLAARLGVKYLNDELTFPCSYDYSMFFVFVLVLRVCVCVFACVGVFPTKTYSFRKKGVLNRTFSLSLEWYRHAYTVSTFSTFSLNLCVKVHSSR